jgi:hypothetical protein
LRLYCKIKKRFFRIEREKGRIFGCVGGLAAYTPKNSVFIPLKTGEPYFFVPLRIRLSRGVFPRDRDEKSLHKKQECQLKGTKGFPG